ncbi:MAG: hypothetical protein O7B27_10895 [Gammaproteobacteria bacterium]|nr:hypothetical protein [Gammaproteobacteria bacterium]
MQKTKRAAQTDKQYAKFLPKAYQRKIKDLTREKNKVKRMGTTLTRSKSKAKKRPPRLKAAGEYCSFEGIRGMGYDVVQDDVTLGWFCGAQWRIVALPSPRSELKPYLLLGIQKLRLDSWPVSTSTKATFVSLLIRSNPRHSPVSLLDGIN